MVQEAMLARPEVLSIKQQARRDAILEVAQRHFIRDGYVGTSLSAIAAEAGGSKSTFWSFFASKEELFAASVKKIIEEQVPVIEIDDKLPLEQALREYGFTFLCNVLSPSVVAIYRLLISEAPRFPALSQEVWEEGPGRRQEAIARFFATKIAKGAIRAVDPIMLAAQFHQLCQFRLMMRHLWRAPADITEEAIRADSDASVDLFLFGCLNDVNDARRSELTLISKRPMQHN